MSNHLHLVVQIDPTAVSAWDDDEVAARWVRLFPPRENEDSAIADKCARLIANTSRVQTIRARLADLSWLMRCLAEPIARRANREDACKGRFWEGRYKVQRLCDERALLAAMAYVDLNPIRAEITDRLEDSAHTSVAVRIAEVHADPQEATAPLRPILGVPQAPLALSTADYLQLLDWTGRQLHPGKRGRIAADAPAVLRTLDADPSRWTSRVRGIGSGYWRVVGTAKDLYALAEAIGQRWLKGQGFAARMG
ncbi:MAG: transposase [Lysobacteraceae bacterium]|nr:MAG: transposase [Xanthomonadaceae bacterium]